MISTVLTGATIIDGTGYPRYVTDIGIVDDRIALIGNLDGRDAHTRLDCRGKAVSPGFIDGCSHSDETWLTLPAARSKTSQGVTTEIAGMCGRSLAPSGKQESASVELFLHASRAAVGADCTIYVGLSGLALASPEAAVREACEQGARGVSIRIDDPSRFDVAAALPSLEAARDAGAPRCAVHLPLDARAKLEALQLAIDLTLRAGVSLHVSHHVVPRTSDDAVMYRTLEAIARARERGARVTCDASPYVSVPIEGAALLPDGIAVDALADPQFAAAAALYPQTRFDQRWHDLALAQTSSEAMMQWCGMRVDDLARSWRLSPARALLRAIEADPAARFFYFCAHEDDVAAALSAEFTCIGTDEPALPVDPQAFYGQPHPRAFGAFPRVFGRFVRQRGTLSLEEAVRRMTSLPAQIFGVPERGELREGAYADLVVFDPETIRDTATYERAVSLPVGIDAVFRNGTTIVDARGTRKQR